jgi:pimeloyl-ACP methyl ester carboxylesterase
MNAKLHIERSGAGEPVVLLHSSGLSGGQWRRLVPELVKRGVRTVVPDLTGHGASEPWLEPEPFSFHIDVEQIAELVRAEGGAHVVGHSYGALVALHTALAAPGFVRSLTLYEPVSFGVLEGPEDADVRATLGGVSMHWGTTPEEHEAWLERFVEFWGSVGGWKALREQARAEFRRVGWVVREGVRSLTEDTTRGATLAAIEVPLHLFAGERSPAPAGRVTQRLKQAIPTAHLTTIPGIGHMGPVANADIVNPLLIAAITAS